MSSVKALADAEAERAEAENPDEPDTPEPVNPDAEPVEPIEPDEPTEPTEPVGPPESAADADARGKKLDSEDRRHETALKNLYGADWRFMTDCPLCLNHGFVPNSPPDAFDPMQRLAVLTAMGEGGARVLKKVDRYTACETCDGEGFVDTQSKRDGFREQPCDDCQGKGYRDRTIDQAYRDVAAAPTLAAVPTPVGANGYQGEPTTAASVSQGGHTFQTIPGAAPDQHGRMAGHPLWGFPAEAGGF